MDNMKLAELLFPHITKSPEEYEDIFPVRELPEGARVTRMAPSPTGFIHLGNLFSAFADERLAHQSGGVFYLRIEDTDDKRYVEGAVETIVNVLDYFQINFDEGAGITGDKGDYGPYHQSQRAELYQTFVKKMVQNGQAYPCFLTEEELSDIRAQQEAIKANPGIYGKWAVSRDLTLEQIEENLKAGKPYVMRLKSKGQDLPPEEMKTITVNDAIRGDITMPENNMDLVILKATGIPTYHFAHVIDDHFMRTTHVVRGEEWLSSLPLHVELFETMGWPHPVYCHTAHLMKIDETGNKRKLSKRKDPELSLDYYRRDGYHPMAVREYLLNILNSNFEEWRIANPDAPIDEFQFTAEKMSNSGALFDLNKLSDVCKDVLVKIPAAELCQFMIDWAKEFRPEILPLFEGNEAYIEQILDLGRTGNKPRKDLVCAVQIFDFIKYFFDDHFVIENELPENVSKEDAKAILETYLAGYDHNDDQSVWFDKIRTFGAEMGYAAKPKDFKKNPDMYKGHVGDVSTVVRLAVTGRSQSPDIWGIQQILGEERTIERVKAYAAQF
ncbi:MAG: glutamate--tRNA ligase [Firmicutes bacterium]|nr:glutamate--tRNA ligase [Bacillota bacterium]